MCGQYENYSRFFIIPSLYRTHLPEELKSHRSHDIVLMCFTCHDRASRSQDKLKAQLADQYNLPLYENMPNKQKNVTIMALNKAATTLFRSGSKMPAHKVDALRKILLEEVRKLPEGEVPAEILESKVYTEQLLNFSLGL